MISIFKDKSTIILRKMLKEPTRSWVIHDFTKEREKKYAIGQGRVQIVLNEMEKIGYIEREKKGAKSKTILSNSEKLIEDWTNAYRFEFNEVSIYYSPDNSILKKIREYFISKKMENKYALTLHSGANLTTSFVKTENIYFYFHSENMKKDILDLRQTLNLKQLVSGGNVYVIKPHYKQSVYFNTQKIKGYKVVSNLQLYLDLYNFQPRDREQAEYLLRLLKEKGKCLD